MTTVLLGSVADVIAHLRGLPGDAELLVAYPCGHAHHASAEGRCTVQLTSDSTSYEQTRDLPERIVLEAR